jgi:hypothetical protein
MSSRPRGAVLDHDRLRTEEPVLLDDRAPELRVGEFFAQDVHEIKPRAFHGPGGADRIVGKLGGLVGGVPALMMRSKSKGSPSRKRWSQAALIMPPPAGAGRCWYWAAKFISPIVKRMRSSADSGSRGGSSASPAERRNAHAPASGVSKALCRHLLAENRKGSYNGVHERTGSRPAVRRKWQRGTRVNSHILFIFPEEGKARKILVLNATNPLKSHDSEERTQGKTKKTSKGKPQIQGKTRKI